MAQLGTFSPIGTQPGDRLTTSSDIESGPFIEALVQLRHRLGRDYFFSIAVSYVPIINGEEKTKPTQHATKQMRSAGLIPDIVGTKR